MDDFIEVDPDDQDEIEDRRARQQKQKARLQGAKQRGAGRKAGFGAAAAMAASSGSLTGINREAWEEISEIFGNGDDFAWAMEEEDDPTMTGLGAADAAGKKEPTLRDVRLSVYAGERAS